MSQISMGDCKKSGIKTPVFREKSGMDVPCAGLKEAVRDGQLEKLCFSLGSPLAFHYICGQLVTSYELQATSYKLRATGYELQATGYELQATSYELRVTSYKLQATSYKL